MRPASRPRGTGLHAYAQKVADRHHAGSRRASLAAARGETSKKMARVGIVVWNRSTSDEGGTRNEFVQELRERGWVEGQNIVIRAPLFSRRSYTLARIDGRADRARCRCDLLPKPRWRPLLRKKRRIGYPSSSASAMRSGAAW